ncbi:MAG TPA: Era-like GTP-binding protein [Candidatus Thermoplasmatota archaeon]|nr:Era-like GTP-binding protein [Candidatus Thermoplasmatota archaeon]
MGFVDWLRRRFRFGGLFRKKKGFRMGIYGSPNAGKTTLANAMLRDYTGEVMGTVSEVPHETRRVLTKQEVVMKTDQGTLIVDVMDTPGLASRVDAMDFELMYNMDEATAQKRAAEARQGIVEAIEALETLDAMLLVLDAADDPYQQVNQVLLTHVQARKLPMIVVANKIDLPHADAGRIQKMFQRHTVVGISAKTGQNLDQLYETLVRSFGS